MVVLFTVSCAGEGSSPAETKAPPGTETPSSSDGGRSLAGTNSSPCRLIGDEEASDLLASPVAGNQVGAGLCDYAPVDLTLGRVDVELFLQDVSATGCELYFSVGGFDNAVAVDGIGTAARWKVNNKQLGVCIDEQATLTITMYDPDRTLDARATAAAMAELAVSRLLEP